MFKLDTTGKETVLHSFTNAPDGASPYSSLVMDKEGNLCGTTAFGGSAYGTCSRWIQLARRPCCISLRTPMWQKNPTLAPFARVEADLITGMTRSNSSCSLTAALLASVFDEEPAPENPQHLGFSKTGRIAYA